MKNITQYDHKIIFRKAFVLPDIVLVLTIFYLNLWQTPLPHGPEISFNLAEKLLQVLRKEAEAYEARHRAHYSEVDPKSSMVTMAEIAASETFTSLAEIASCSYEARKAGKIQPNGRFTTQGPNVIKMNTSVILQIFVLGENVFPGTLFQSSLIFVGKGRSIPWRETPGRGLTRVGSGLFCHNLETRQGQTIGEVVNYQKGQPIFCDTIKSF